MGVTVAKDILDEVRGTYLNDPNGTEATDEKLLSKLRTAYSLLECECESNGLQLSNSEVVAKISSGQDEYYPLPPDLTIPRTVSERQYGTSDEFRTISYRNNLPQITPTPYLEFWTYRLERLLFVPATTDREIKLFYMRSFPKVNTSDGVVVGKADTYLAAKTAALYLMFDRQSPSLAEPVNEIAEKKLEDFVSTQVKLMQAAPVRRKGYLPYRFS
jgi:hypothetical protein